MPDARTAQHPQPPAPPAVQGGDWRDTLPADWTAPARDESGAEVQIPLRNHPALAKYSSKDEAIKALVHAQRLLGKKPGQGRSLLSLGPEDGPARPESPEGYALPELELPEDFRIDEALKAAFLAKAHELGLSDSQAGGLFAWFVPMNVQAAQTQAKTRAEQAAARRRAGLEALRQAHGDTTLAIAEKARKAVLALGGEPLLKALEDCGAADEPCVVQAFARMAPSLGEAGLRARNGGSVPALTPAKLREMMRDPRYHDPSRRDADYVRQVQQGFESLYPGERAASAPR